MPPENEEEAKSAAERWFEEQQAWQQTMREYSDAMMKDEQFITHLGNAMRGSLLAGTAYPQASPPGMDAPVPGADKLDEVLFALKRVEGRLRDLEAAVAASNGGSGHSEREADAGEA